MKKICLYGFLVILSACSSAPDSEQMTMSTLWYQHSAEMRALYYQAFAIAEMRVNQMMENYDNEKIPAVVVDIDETILDNSPSEAKNILEGDRFSRERWLEWTRLAIAEPLPGSLEFATFLEQNGVELFYISNRSEEELESTIENLQKHGFPFADQEHIFLKTDSSGKKLRREKVAANNQILLLIGDNLGDFSEVFDDRSRAYGKNVVDSLKHEFGRRFIVLPNPMYGSWTSALYGSTSGLTPREIAEKRKSYLSGPKMPDL